MTRPTISHRLSAHALRTTTAALLVPIPCAVAPVRGMADDPLPGAWLKRWIDASAKPADIDFRNTAGEMKGKTWLGIYELDGDTLRICDNAEDVARGRPAAFVSDAGSGQVLISFKRAKR